VEARRGSTMKRGRATVYFRGEASIRLRPFSRLLVLGRLEVRRTAFAQADRASSRPPATVMVFISSSCANEVVERRRLDQRAGGVTRIAGTKMLTPSSRSRILVTWVTRSTARRFSRSSSGNYRRARRVGSDRCGPSANASDRRRAHSIIALPPGMFCLGSLWLQAVSRIPGRH